MAERIDAIAALGDRLRDNHPQLRFELRDRDGERWLRIEAPNPGGFDVTLLDDLDEWTVYYGAGGHCHFERAEDALENVVFALSEDCRLVETWRGQFLQKSKLQVWTGSRWRMASVYGVLFFPFWRRATRLVFQNRYIKRETEE